MCNCCNNVSWWNAEPLAKQDDYVFLKLGCTEEGEIIIAAETDYSTAVYHPKFCPECGRKI